jgi:hypothetical protein
LNVEVVPRHLIRLDPQLKLKKQALQGSREAGFNPKLAVGKRESLDG